jgi:Carboxypeptidase regulatory-like domain
LAAPEITADVIANEARRLEARLLGLPVPLEISAPAPPPKVSALTNSGGRYRFDNLDAGNYRIYVSRDGYFGALPQGSAETTLPVSAMSSGNVQSMQTVPEIQMTLVLRATVSGKVRDSKGQPVVGARVSAYRSEYQNLRTILLQVDSSSTDDRGDYRLFSLPPGDYYIGATPGFTDSIGRFQSAYTQIFFHDVIDARNASRVKVTEGAELAGIDIGIHHSSTNMISGNSVNTSGLDSLIAWKFFLLQSDAGLLASNEAPNTAANRTNGYFEFRGVATGAYDLVASKIDRLTGVTAIGRTKIDVGS